ncbi:DUF72 domain-containing protein [Amantichitinum ursilacus]|uniref:DUF72 domain-containing protein n=1 Tax=Amantichitinum ursilacus TaxID=857265 RepID=A0A0N0XKQ1_9NEIS|nr:DUF72 domain-containing protein [Amantichitinum ursilacus]KPC54719.1 hypothetical protein WG78_04075 [Amantichitinum ursilacus]
MARAHIGISGWRYEPWRKVFYPEELRQADELHYASRALSSIEINGSFYALQTPDRYADWYASTPNDFIFSVKAPRFITHIRRLRDIDGPLANFFASGLFELKEKLGPLLWQFPPSFQFDAELFESFLAKLPRDLNAARTIAEHHDSHLRSKPDLDVPHNHRMRHAIEIRHQSFATPEFIALLRKYHVALVVADTAGKWPHLEDLSAPFVYVRLHGAEKLYASGYTDTALDDWAARIKAWTSGHKAVDGPRVAEPATDSAREVFCYFDNDIKVRAPFDAQRLMQRLDQPIRQPAGEPLPAAAQ